MEEEQTYIHSWLGWGFDPETIQSAYEKTLVNKGSLVWPYMNGILLKWHEKGLHRLEQIQSADQKTAAGRNDTPFTPGESEMQAIAAMKRKREAKKEE